MTDKKTTPTDEDRRLARKWAASIIRTPRTSLPMETAAARVILHTVPAPSRPTLADMTLDEQDECAGMQADLAQGDRVVILDGTPDSDDSVQVLEMSLGVFRPRPADVTPRPDLPRLEWPSGKKPAPAPALPEGWRLADHEKHGRVMVTNPTPDKDGHVYFVAPAPGAIGNDWHLCKRDELTYIEQESADAAD